ncbi:MAG: phenylacetic acid degradation protein PaaB [Actinomycetota bacterium]|nr:phenylacetic acid degradation protein PaaB [Actinomycetota bacterium]
MDVWEVFQQKSHQDPFVHVGSVLAPDDQMALSYAKECFFRRKEGKGLWVAKRHDIHVLLDTKMLEQVTDKSYRYPEAYRGVVEKREIARARAGASATRAPSGKDTALAGDEFE